MHQSAATPPLQTTDVCGLQTGFRRQGEGEPLLFVVGPWLAGRWLPLHEALSRQFDVTVADHPGMGETALPTAFSDWTDVAIHYAALMDALGVPAVHLVGHGFGGWVAAEIAAVYPERLRSLTLLAPWGLRPERAEPMVNLFRTTDDEELALSLGDDLPRWRHEVVDVDPGTQLVRSFQERTAMARVAWNPRYDLKLEHRLKRVTAPALILVPEHDGVVAPSVARTYADVLPGARLERVAGQAASTEHLFVLQEPEAIARHITELTDAEATA